MTTLEPSAGIILLPTKLNRPPLTGDFVVRPRLLAKLNSGLSRKLILISAPAGFGKSTLAVSWLQSLTSPNPVGPPVNSAWFSCDEGDNSLAHFLRYVIAAVRIVFPNAFERLTALIEAPELPPVAYLANVILAELSTLPDEFFLVLEDFHLINDPATHRLVAAVLAGMSPRAHLVLITRYDPPLPLARLRVQQQLTEVRASDLRFSEAEAAAFVSNALGRPLPPGAVAKLEDQTEGWIAAMRLAAISMQESSDPEQVVDALAAARRPAMEFLAEQVLEQQDEDMRYFLLRSAILDRMSSEVCAAVLCLDGPAGSCGRDWLERLERSNMFLIPLDAERNWYRYHHLFREFLLARLAQTADASEIADSHRRAAEWFVERGLAEEATRHYLAAGETDYAAAIVGEWALDMNNAERLAAADQLLALLPQPLTRATVLIAKCWTLVFRWRLRDLVDSLDQAAAALANDDAMRPETAARLTAHLDALAAMASIFAQDDPARGAERAQSALDRLAAGDTHAYFTAMLVLGVAFNRLGRREEALARLRGELALALEGRHKGAFRQLIGLATIYLQGADLERLGDCASSLLELGVAAGLYNSIAFASYFLGCKALLQGDPLAAIDRFGRVVELRYLANAKAYQDSLHGLALARQALGEADAAQEAAQAALAFATESLTPRDAAESRAILTRLALLRGEDARKLALGDPPPAFTWNAYIEMPALTHARLLLARGSPADLAAAQVYLAEAQVANRAAHDDRRLVEGLALEAVALWRLGRKQDARSRAQEALALAEPGRLALPFLEARADFAALLADLPEGVAATFRSRLLSQMGAGATAARRRSTVSREDAELLESLTNREEEVLRLLVERMSNKEIAEALTISPLTAHKHVTNILGKLQVRNRRQAALKARALGLVE
ncbi:MAG: LuxR C-terminal-related transcriptional regulator [Anaerolineae bacterium]|nr:LuxR C-terminal-related transcriptional regulator [Anaerolineae bacterium]